MIGLRGDYCSYCEHAVMRKVRILGIAPYEGLADLMLLIAKQRNDIDLTVYTASLEEAAAFISGMDLNDFDIILSRGGTVLCIQQITDVPVFDINISYYDILNAIKLADNTDKKPVIVASPKIISFSKQICGVLKYDIDTYATTSWKDTVEAIGSISEKNRIIILGDTSACRCAEDAKIPSILIASGLEVTRAAFDQAVSFSRYYMTIREENHILKSYLILNQATLFAYNINKTLIFCSMRNPSNFFMVETKKMINDLAKTNNCIKLCKQNGISYVIRGFVQKISNSNYYIFQIQLNTTSSTYLTNSLQLVLEETFKHNLFQFLYSSPSYKTTRERISSLKNSLNPVMLFCEEGIGEDYMAKILQSQSIFKDAPLYIINCKTLDAKEWQSLIRDICSPIHGTQHTFFFNHFDKFSSNVARHVVAYISSTRMDKRNQLIFSCSLNCKTSENFSNYNLLTETLSCIEIILPTLFQCIDEISDIVTMFLGVLNADSSKRLIGIEPEAINLLQGFQWTNSLSQLRKVLLEAFSVTDANDFYIHAETIQNVLKNERRAPVQIKQALNSDLNLDQSLKKITQDIILKVMALEGGNQSATAKRLHISRTTLWKILQQ